MTLVKEGAQLRHQDTGRVFEVAYVDIIEQRVYMRDPASREEAWVPADQLDQAFELIPSQGLQAQLHGQQTETETAEK